MSANAASHPQIIQRTDAILLSINDCLRHLVNYEVGESFTGLDQQWLIDCIGLKLVEAEEMKKHQDEIEEARPVPQGQKTIKSPV